MSEGGQIIRAHALEPGCLIEIEGDQFRSGAKVQAVRDTAQGIEIDLWVRKPIKIPAGCAAVNYWTLRVAYDTPVRVSHLPSQISGDTSTAHGIGHQQGRHT